MSFPKYEAYKDSGVEWLGEVPEHWEVCRITHHLQSVVDYRGRTPQKDNSGVFLVTAKNIRNGLIDYETSQEFITEVAYQEVIQRGRPCIGDVVFTTEAPLGQVANLDRDDIALAQRIIKFSGIPRVVDNYFLKYWIMGNLCQSELESLATGSTALGIKGSKVNQLHFCMPPFSEQTQIARFLDHETARIDALIAEQERLIELLKEKRQAVISHAVTKGCDSNVPMKDSGVEWLGEVPEHWEIKRLKFLIFGIEGGFSPQCYSYPPDKGEWGVLKSGCVNGGIFNPQVTKALPEEVIPPLDLEVFKGDVLMSRASGSVDLIGSVARVEEQPKARLLLSDKTFRLKLRLQIVDPDFFVTVMGSSIIRRQIRQAISGAEGLANNIAQSDIKELTLPFPPLGEQQKITHFLKQELETIDSLASTSIKSLALLQERRSALISAAVTGKIDVRDWQPPMSDAPAATLEAAYG